MTLTMTPTVPLTRDLVLIGGGHTHALVLRKWGMRPVPGVRVTLIDPGPMAPYTGMLPGHVAGHYAQSELEIDLVRLARFAGARFVPARAESIDPIARRVAIAGRPPIGYDLLSIDVGITSEMGEIPGFSEFAVAAKPLGPFAARWRAFCDGVGPAHVALIGAGIAGVELALTCAWRLKQLDRPARITLIDRGDILTGVPPRARARLMAELDAAGIACIASDAPVSITADAVDLASGATVRADLTIGVAGARPHAWLSETGLATERGFLAVGPDLRSISHPDVYAAGDCAHLTHAPRPKAGVYAVRAAPVLAHNLRADLTGGMRRSFRPQRDALKLVSLGDARALAERSGLVLSGALMWRWKDRIDRQFMRRFADYPTMPAQRAPAGAARGVAAELSGPQPCGGCGAKLGSGALSGLLGTLSETRPRTARATPWDDAAVLPVGGVEQVLSTDHLRAFSEDPALLARVAAVHAMGDIWAMGATPQAALAQVILPRMAVPLQRRWLEEIMAEAVRTFADAGVEVVGGHSSMGGDLTLGFTVTGVLDRPAITLAGGRPGDALILTKPIGTGVILAGEMRGLANGRDVVDCWAQMGRPQGDAAGILAPAAHAMTDVTGFGLAGHLANLCTASNCGAGIDLGALPVLRGALALSERGVRSTLFAQNRAALEGRVDAPETRLADLVFDPQTAGGLLAAVPRARASDILDRLADLQQEARCIGVLTEDPMLRFA